MPILPQVLLNVTSNLLPLILPLIQALFFQQIRQQFSEHWLLNLEDWFDLTPLIQGCQGFYKGEGPGSSTTYTIPQLVRALLVKHLYHYSYRQTEEMITCHLVIRIFVGCGLFEPVPDHSTIARFEKWVQRHQARLFFDEVLVQIKHHDPDDQTKLELVDSFAMLARAAKTSLIPMLRDACRQLLNHLQAADGAYYDALLTELDETTLFGQQGDKPTRALSEAERAERLGRVVEQVYWLYHRVQERLVSVPCLSVEHDQALRQDLVMLKKILVDETTLQPEALDRLEDETATEPGSSASLDEPAALAPPLDLETTPDPLPDAPQVTERPHGKKGSYRIGAISDTDATYRHHGADKGESAKLAYNASILASSRYIYETQADTGCRPDGEALPEMLHRQYETQGFFPHQTAGDMAYGAGKVRAMVEQISHGQTQMVALVPTVYKNSDLFNPTDFTLSNDGLTLTCPNGVVSDKFYDLDDREGVDFRYTAAMCRDCPLWDKCRKPGSNPKSPRKVFISHYRPYIAQALVYNKTPEFKLIIKRRPHIERIIFNLTHLHGARRATATGQPKADYQLRMAATAFNIRQLLRRKARAVLKLKPGEACV